MDVDQYMNPKLKSQKKLILSDPVAEFSSRHPGADEKTKSALIELQQQAMALNDQRKKAQIKTKIISRHIGEAKRNNQSIEAFMISMRQQSSQLEHLTEQLCKLENRILKFFKSKNHVLSNNEEPKEITPGGAPVTRHYTASINNTDNITVSLLDNEHNEWNAYVSKQPAATIHHLSEWRDLLHKTYHHESFYFLARDSNQQIVGVLPLIRLKSRLFGDLLVSMPYFQRGGAVADHPLIEQKLIQTANNQAAQLRIDYIEYRDDIPREKLPVQSHKVNMILSLPDSKDALWASFTAKLRAQIKRPQREKSQVLVGGEEYLDDFYKVYTRNMRDLGSPAHSKLFIKNILDSFPQSSWVIVLYLNNKPVSAGLLLGYGNTMEIPLASTIRKVNPLSMNMLLYWEALKLAIHHGYKAFDFGRSSKDAGTYRFKQQWGAQPGQLYWHYWLGETNELPSLNPSNPKYALVINIWKRLPVTLTRWLGPSIVKNIP